MVEQLLAGTQGKIDAQEGLKKQTEWKQEIYRELIASIHSLQSNYFSKSASTSLGNASFFNAMVAASQSAALKATATTLAVKGDAKIEVHQLASSHSLTSGSAVSGKLSGQLSEASLQKLLDNQYGGDRKLIMEVSSQNGATSRVEVDLKPFFVSDGALCSPIDTEGIAGAIQMALEKRAG
jgi:flagellar capping protein FliD